MIRFSLLRSAELLHEDSLASYRAEIAFGLLTKSPNAGQFQLDEIIKCILSNPVVHSRFLVLADRVLGGGASLGTIQRDKWFAAYLPSPAKWEDKIREFANLRPGVIFEIRDRGGYGRLPMGQGHSLTLPQMEFLAKPISKYLGDTDYPTHVFSGDFLSSRTVEWLLRC
jgi:hypothetical protein